MEQQQDIFTDEIDKSLLAAFAWWEKRRLAYNLIVGITGLVALFFLSYFSFIDVIGVIIYGIIANVFYCIGFILEVADKHYFKSSLDLSERREGLFWCGVIFSVLATLGIGLFIGFMQSV